jgi:hypothetical protein
VQSSREAARGAACRNNLRQAILGVLHFESGSGTLPGLYNGGFRPRPRSAIDEFHFHPWRTAILPGIERADVLASLNLDLPATVAANQTGLNAAIGTFVCPSSANPTRNLPELYAWNDGAMPTVTFGSAARSDYEVVGGIHTRPPGTAPGPGGVIGQLILDGVAFGAWGEPTYREPTFFSTAYRRARLADVTDGLANTALIGERAGRPDCYEKGKAVDPYPYSDPVAGCGDPHQAAWGISTHFPWLLSVAGQPVNASNRIGFYAFHPVGAHVAMGDGSVRALRESTAAAVLQALATRSGGEAVATGD